MFGLSLKADKCYFCDATEEVYINIVWIVVPADIIPTGGQRRGQGLPFCKGCAKRRESDPEFKKYVIATATNVYWNRVWDDTIKNWPY